MTENDLPAESVADEYEAENPENTPPAAAAHRKKRSARSYALSFLIKLAVTALVLWIVFTFIAGILICHTNSAYPSVKDGDFCLTYRRADLKEGKMIVYKKDGRTKFGRIIAFGGDEVTIFNDFITVNDYPISENVVYQTSPEGSAISYPYKVPENSVFVLNDYRSDINDSRTYGGIPLSDVKGTVVFTMRMRGI